jgi:predicted N-acetyltransferase YhbS
VIRAAGEADLAAIAGLRRAWAEETGDPGFEARLAEWLASPSRLVLLAESDAAVVGMVALTWYERMPRPGATPSGWAYLGQLFVLPAFRGAGLGTALTAAAEEQAREWGAVRIVLAPSEKSVPLYERAGFRPADMLRVKPPS